VVVSRILLAASRSSSSISTLVYLTPIVVTPPRDEYIKIELFGYLTMATDDIHSFDLSSSGRIFSLLGWVQLKTIASADSVVMSA
jgi:hypothetical protein